MPIINEFDIGHGSVYLCDNDVLIDPNAPASHLEGESIIICNGQEQTSGPKSGNYD